MIVRADGRRTSPALVILGAGVAGVSAAKAARAADPSADLTLITAEAALPYFRPDLSKSFLLGDEDHPSLLATTSDLAEAGINLVTGWTAEKLDLAEKRLLGAGREFRFDRLLLASGATAIRPVIDNMQLRGIFQLRTVGDATRLRAALATAKQIAVIGGGLIGLEIASTATSLGKPVTVIEKAPRALARILPEQLSAIVADHHRTQGVRLMLDTDVLGFSGQGAVEVVETSAGSVAADLVVVAVGARPDTHLAETAGIACRDGILVDRACQTSYPDVFAAGDVTRICDQDEDYRLEAWRHADEQGTIAGTNLAGGGARYVASPWFWSDQGQLHIQGCGYPVKGAEVAVRQGEDGRSVILFQLRGGKLQAGFCLSFDQGFARDIAFLQRLVALLPKIAAETIADRSVPLKTLFRSLPSTTGAD